MRIDKNILKDLEDFEIKKIKEDYKPKSQEEFEDLEEYLNRFKK